MADGLLNLDPLQNLYGQVPGVSQIPGAENYVTSRQFGGAVQNVIPSIARGDNPLLSLGLGGYGYITEGQKAIQDLTQMQKTRQDIIKGGYDLLQAPLNIQKTQQEISEKQIDINRKNREEIALLQYIKSLPESEQLKAFTNTAEFTKNLFATTPDIIEYQKYQQDPGFFDYQIMLNQAKRQITNINANISTEAGKDVIGDLQNTYTSGMESRKNLTNYDTMIGLIDQGLKTGPGAPAALFITRAGQLFNPEFNVEKGSQLEQFDALGKTVVIPQVKKLGVNPTNVDLRFIVDSSPSLGKTPEGNKIMLETLKLASERDAAIAEWAANWQINNADLLEKKGVLAQATFNRDRNAFIENYINQRQQDKINELRARTSAVLKQTPTGTSKFNTEILFR